MSPRGSKRYSLILIIVDVLVLLAVFTLAYIIRVQIDSRPLVTQIYAVDFLLSFLSVVPFWIISFAILGLYKEEIRTKRLNEIGKLLVGCVVGILIILGYAFLLDKAFFPARLVAVYAFFGSFIALVVVRSIVHAIYENMLRNGRASRVLVVGNSPAAQDIIGHLGRSKRSGYKVVALAGPQKLLPDNSKVTCYSSVDEALKNLGKHRISTIIQTNLYESSSKNQRVLEAAQTNHIDYSFIPGEAEFYAGKNTVGMFAGYPIILVSQTPLIGWGKIVKRIFDVIATAILLVVLSPIYLILIILQIILNPGPVIYKSRRLSRYSQPFALYKFRSMRPEFGKKDAAEEFRDMDREDLAKEYEAHRKVKNDPRITPFGHFLRKTSLDELPQLVNALKGDLSLVGPRPILPQEMKLVKSHGPILHSVQSGVTGLWQISGRNELSFDQRIDLELYYARNWSFWLDIKILFRTLWVVIKKSGAR